MGECADDALDREINDWVGPRDEEDGDKYDEHPHYVKIPQPKVGDKCDQVGCKGHLVEKTNLKTNTKFLGCSEFPKCKRSYSINFWRKHG